MAGLNHLGRRIDGYAETWKEDHDRVMSQWEIADCLGEEANYGIYLFSRLKNKSTRTFEDAKALYNSYLEWHAKSERLLLLIDNCEKQDFPVEGSAEFRNAFTEVGSIVTKIQGRIDALTGFINGHCAEASDFLAGL